MLDIPKKSAPQKQPYDSTDVIMSTLLLVESFKVRCLRWVSRFPWSSQAARLRRLRDQTSHFTLQRIVGRIIHPSMDDVDVTEASKRLYCAEFCVLFVDDEGKLSYVNEPAQVRCLEEQEK